MAKQRAPIEINSLSGGLITEANALTFPDSASLDESNFELTKDGKRTRRLGFAQELGGEGYPLDKSYESVVPNMVNTFLWENVGGRGDVSLSVVQVGDELHYYHAGESTLSANKLPQVTKIAGATENLFTFAVVDGTLAVATGLQEVTIVSPSFSAYGLSGLQASQERLTIRDLFGISVIYDRSVEGTTATPLTIDITKPEYITKRPLLAGLPSVTTRAAEIEFETDGVNTWITESFANTGGAQDQRYKTTNIGTDIQWNSFSPAEFYGYKLVRVVNYTTVYTTYSGDFISDVASGSYIEFDSEPEFTVIFVDGSVFTKAEGYWGKRFEGTANIGTSFTLAVDTDTISSTLYNYNLRNQTFGVKRLPKTGAGALDPIQTFYALDEVMPSMSDTVTSALYNNLDETNKTADRFHAEDLVDNPVGSVPAPKGYFIIDALDRAESRKIRWQELADAQGYSGEVADLPSDRTPAGPRAIAEYSGRLWYGGFSEEGSTTDENGIRLESYLLFSQLANSRSVLTRCYQKGDPTSTEAPELLDTDGGFISLDGAYGISSVIPLGNSLLVFGANGVWAITGSDGNYFTPTSPRVQKVTDKGSISPRAIVTIDTSVMYWTRDGIYLISLTETGSYKVESLTERTIQTLYTGIPLGVRATAFGDYDPFTSEVTWYVYNSTGRTQATQVLVLKTTSGAFTTYTISDGTVNRTLVGPAQVSPFAIGEASFDVVVGVDKVLAGVDEVKYLVASRVERTSSIKGVYLEQSINGLTTLSFGEYNDTDFKDWGEVDAPAYMVTGYVSGGDFQRYKQTPYITFHFDRTEDGFEEDIDGNLTPTGQSSCLVQAQWEWADSVNSGRWGRQFQAYRYRKPHMPSGVDDPYDVGYSTIVTRNKIRGKGRVLSLKLETEEGKDCRVLGWSTIMGVNSNV
jgi:hypothetical protein